MWFRNVSTLAAGVLLVVLLSPMLGLFVSWLEWDASVWSYLLSTELSRLITNTLELVLGVAVGVSVLGVALAWLVCTYEFPGRRVLEWALVLPMAMPGYVLAFVLVALLDYSGPIYTAARHWFGSDVWFPVVRSQWGVIVVLSLVLYPYVYLLARSAFAVRNRECFEASRTLGFGPIQTFWRVALPMARPSVLVGVSLALMETLADFGTVSVFNYDTFTTAIYSAWFGLFSWSAASQLSAVLLVFVAIVLGMEMRMRGAARFHHALGRAERKQLGKVERWVACFVACGVVFVGFLGPIIQMAWWSFEFFPQVTSRDTQLVFNTLMLAGLAALIVVSVALFFATWVKRRPKSVLARCVRLAALGYALPGTVLAVAVMLVIAFWDRTIGSMMDWRLIGTVAGLLLAYSVRFFAVGYGTISSALEKVKPSLLEAGRVLGVSPLRRLMTLTLPLVRSGLLTAVLLVLVEVMKEMPATLLLRPFGWDTLAVRIFELTSEGDWTQASVPGLALVLISLLPVIVIIRRPNL